MSFFARRTGGAAFLAVVVLGLAAPALAQDVVPSLTDGPRAARLGGPTTLARGALMLGGELAVLGAGGVASYLVGATWASKNFQATGRPDPQVIAGAIAVSLALNMAISCILLPELSRLTNDGNGVVEVGFVRRETWRTTRWIALAGLVFVGILIAGATMEKSGFDRGQALMIVGGLGAAASLLTFDVAALFVSHRATEQSRRLTPAPN